MTIHSISLDDMRCFAQVAESGSFTGAARRLGLPKQTLSRRVAELERALDVQLLHRTTRRLRLTQLGAAYAARCADLVRLAEEANRALTDAEQTPRGVLRVTADPVFGDAFVAGLLVEYAQQWPEVAIELVLTRRKVDLIEEGFDAAFRIGSGEAAGVTATRLGPARIHYCASPAYLAGRPAPVRPEDLSGHACILVASDALVGWPFRGAVRSEARRVTVAGRVRSNSFALAHAACLAGLGVALFPEFACADDLAAGRLVSVLEDWVPELGAVWLLHPAARFLSARLRAFVELALSRFGAAPPWDPTAAPPTEGAGQAGRRP